jgi:hypothetical protein
LNAIAYRLILIYPYFFLLVVSPDAANNALYFHQQKNESLKQHTVIDIFWLLTKGLIELA